MPPMLPAAGDGSAGGHASVDGGRAVVRRSTSGSPRSGASRLSRGDEDYRAPTNYLQSERRLGDFALLGFDARVRLGLTRAEGADRPRTRPREEAERAGRRGHDLGGELTRGVEQPHVGTALGLPTTTDRALNDRFGRHINPFERQVLDWSPAHAQTSFSIGTPTREPYSVHEPS